MATRRSEDGAGPAEFSSALDSDLAEIVDRELQRCLDHAAEALHWVGPDGTILWANRTELHLLGYSAEEYLGHHIAEFHVDAPVIADILARLTRGETLLNYPARLRRKDGSIRDVEINSNVLWRDERFLHTRCFTRDVTERRSADAVALRLADIVEHSDDAIISHDLSGVISSWNPAAQRLYGYPPAEAIGRSIDVIIPADRAAEETEVLARVRRGERVPTFDTLRRHKDGSTINVALTVSPILDREGRIVGASKMARDISNRKRAEARDRFLLELDATLRPLTDAEEITFTAAAALGRHLHVNRCAYATVEDDEDTFVLTGNYTDGVQSIVGRYTFRQFGEECLRLMRTGEPYVVSDAECDERINATDRASYVTTEIRSVICVPILKQSRFVAAMAVHMAEPRAWLPDEVRLVQRVASRSWESIERARIGHELEEREHLFRALANSIAHLAWMARPDGSIYWYNDQWYAYTGTAEAEMQGWGWEQVHDPLVLPRVKERWLASIKSGRPFEMVFPLRGADGQYRRFLTRVNPVRDSRGVVAHWFGTNTDVENERRATEANAVLRARERAAREEAELQKQVLHSLFMQAPTLIAVLRGPDYVIELANPPMCRIWAHTEEDLRNRPLFEVLPELRDQVFRPLLDEVCRTGVAHVGTETPAKFDRGNGTVDTVYFNFVYSPFRNVSGEIESIFVIASDVTEQVLARLQINQLRESAEAANRAKDEFLAMLGHELRNPLAPILTALQLMKLRGDEQLHRERTVIERQVGHLTRLVDDLLDVSRIAQGRVQLKEEPVELAVVVANAIELASPLLERNNHTLSVEVARTGLTVCGDSTRLSQVVSNLLTNAAKYTSPGGQIVVTGSGDGPDVLLRVRDTGIGIGADVLPGIFDLFVQGRQGIDRSHGGLGLGLTIVRNLVEMHRGSVTAHSHGEGQGSEFTVRLPKLNAAAGEIPVLGPTDDVAQTERAALGSRRILAVDDNEDAGTMLLAALTARGHEVQLAHDGPTALRIAKQFRPDVAILDIGLPVMDGYELASRLRECAELSEVRLIALTGYGQETDRERSKAAGFQNHLVKPINLDVVERAVNSEERDPKRRP